MDWELVPEVGTGLHEGGMRPGMELYASRQIFHEELLKILGYLNLSLMLRSGHGDATYNMPMMT